MSTDQINVIMTGIKDLTAKTVQKLVLDINADLKENTPVDTGWARANWTPSVGTPYSADVGANPLKDTAAVTGATAIAEEGIAQILNYKLEDGAAFVSNNVPYIQILDGGSINRPPTGFVRTAVERAISRNLMSVD